MSKLISIMFAISLVAIVGMTGNAFAVNPGDPAQDTFSASVTIIDPVRITAQADTMVFGNVIKPGSGQDDNTGTDSADFLIEGFGGLPIVGTGTAGVGCERDDGNGAGVSIGTTVNSFNSATGILTVDGTVTVTPAAVAGAYTCTYTVTASYSALG